LRAGAAGGEKAVAKRRECPQPPYRLVSTGITSVPADVVSVLSGRKRSRRAAPIAAQPLWQ
jgi:hypothetical protein